MMILEIKSKYHKLVFQSYSDPCLGLINMLFFRLFFVFYFLKLLAEPGWHCFQTQYSVGGGNKKRISKFQKRFIYHEYKTSIIS